LARSRVERGDSLLIAWFGPRGLSSLLLVLLPVFAALPGSEHLFAICCLVVLLSVVVHGASPMLLGRSSRRRAPLEATQPSDAAIEPPVPAAPNASDLLPGGLPAVSSHTDVTAPRGPEVSSSIAMRRIEPSSTDHAGDSTAPAAHGLTMEQLRHLWDAGAPVVILDARTDRTYDPSPTQARGAVRLPPDHVGERAAELNLPRDAWLVAYCA
jgi:sodium/hydrogen antiporter